jgi:hypothetical protein
MLTQARTGLVSLAAFQGARAVPDAQLTPLCTDHDPAELRQTAANCHRRDENRRKL